MSVPRDLIGVHGNTILALVDNYPSKRSGITPKSGSRLTSSPLGIKLHVNMQKECEVLRRFVGGVGHGDNHPAIADTPPYHK